jgi:hypothetical protein
MAGETYIGDAVRTRTGRYGGALAPPESAAVRPSACIRIAFWSPRGGISRLRCLAIGWIELLKGVRVGAQSLLWRWPA